MRKALVVMFALATVTASWLGPAARRAEAICWFNCDYAETRYPIVLAHGASGFDELFGVYEYWYGIPSYLRDSGATVFLTEVSQLNSTEVRGEQLIDQIETITAITGEPKVNLIGHSHGGLDIRYVAATRPDLVASVSAVAGPHRGAELADALQDYHNNFSFSAAVIAYFAEQLGVVLGLLSGSSNEQDAIAALDALDSTGAAALTALYPQGVPTSGCGNGRKKVNGIRYYSWSGTALFTNVLDVSDAAMALTSIAYSEPNDGLVGKCSSHLGKVLRDNYFHNHLDEVNQILGLRSVFASDPRAIFRAHAHRLKNKGL